MTPEQQRLNAEKSLALASALFPSETWIPKEANIWVAKSRLSGGHKEQTKLHREIADVRILTGRGSVAYFLAENEKKGGKIKICVDTVIDGELVELKTVSGNRNTLGTAFEQGFRQGLAVRKDHPEIKTHSIFIRLRSDFSIGSVKAKIAGELKNRPENGKFICYFEHTGELHTWPFEELRSLSDFLCKWQNIIRTEPVHSRTQWRTGLTPLPNPLSASSISWKHCKSPDTVS